MSEQKSYPITIRGKQCRVLEKGSGQSLLFFAGFGGLPKLPPMLDLLADHYKVIALSLPGQHGSDQGHHDHHSTLDWLASVQDLMEAVATPPFTVIASSVAAMLLSEVAALADTSIGKLVLLSPLGLYDSDNPPTNIFAKLPPSRKKFLAENQTRLQDFISPPETVSAEEKQRLELIDYRAEETSARIMWPFGDIGLRQRLYRITCPTLVIWGAEDKIVPASYAQDYAAGIADSTIEIIPNAGHLVYIDAPDTCAGLISRFTG